MDYSERLTRQCLLKLPDGEATFTDWIDDDQIDIGRPIPLWFAPSASMANTMEVDWTGSAPQVKGAINNTLSYTAAMSFTAVKSVLSVNMPNNDGVFRPIRIIAPPGTITNGKTAGGVRGARPDRVPWCRLLLLVHWRNSIRTSVFAASDGGNTGLTIGGYDKELRTRSSMSISSLAPGARRPWADGLDGNTVHVRQYGQFLCRGDRSGEPA